MKLSEEIFWKYLSTLLSLIMIISYTSSTASASTFMKDNVLKVWDGKSINEDTKELRIMTRNNKNHTEHICKQSLPCKNIGQCRVKNDANGKATSDYWCECYSRFYVPNEGSGEECDQKFPKLKEMCENVNCEHRGKCVSLWGNYFCKCTNGYHGLKCHRKRRNWRRMAQPTFVYDIDVTTAYKSLFLVYFKSKRRGRRMTMYYSTGEGLSFTIRKEAFIISSPSTYINQFTSPVIKDILKSTNETYLYFFPYQYSSKDKQLLITIGLRNMNTPQFRGKYPIYITPNRNECVPTVKMKDCRTAVENAPSFTRTYHSVIRSGTEKDCAKYSSTLHHSWKIYQITYSRPIPMDEGKRKNLKKQAFRQPSPLQFQIEPFTFTYGRYAIQLQVEERIARPSNGSKKSHHNKALCFFDVVPEPLVAHLEGGNAQDVLSSSDLILNASKSYDPNEKHHKQNHLKFSWACKHSRGNTISICKGLDEYVATGEELVISSEYLSVGDELEFLVTVNLTKKAAFAVIDAVSTKQTINVVEAVEGALPRLEIQCLKNCGRNINPNVMEVISMRVVCNKHCSGVQDTYEWAMDTNSNKEFNWETDTQFGKQSNKLYINEGVLDPGENYTIKVTGGRDAKSRSAISWVINAKPTEGSCYINPTSGYSGITKFNITCYDFEDEDIKWPLRYEFFQSVNVTDIDLGVLIYYSNEPNALDIFLTEGQVNDGKYSTTISIKVSDFYGLFIVSTLTVQVEPMSNGLKDTNLMDVLRHMTFGQHDVNTIPNLADGGDMSGVVRLATIISDAVASIGDKNHTKLKNEIKSSLIASLEKIPLNSISAISQVASVFDKILNTDVEDLDHNTAYKAAVSIHMISISLLSRREEIFHTTKEIVQVAKCVLSCISTIITPKHITITSPEGEYPEYSDLSEENKNIHVNYDYPTKLIMDTVLLIGETVAQRIVEEEKAVEIHTESASLWVKIDKPSNLAEKILGIEKSKVGVKLSKDLALSVEKDIPAVNFHVAIIHKNPFWWQPEGKDINCDVISINLLDGENKRQLGKLPSPADLYMNVGKLEIKPVNGTMNLSLNSELMEDTIPVHRIKLMKSDTLLVFFEPFTDPNLKLKVVIMQEVRPSLEDFHCISTTIPKDSNNTYSSYLVLTEEIAQQDEAWFYIAFIPDEDTIKRVSQLGTNFMMDYTFKVFKVKCQYWNAEAKVWETEGCSVGPETTPTQVHCRCIHLSIFSSIIFVPPNKIDPIYDIALFLKVSNNVIVLAFVCGTLLFFIILLLWARQEDKKDHLQRTVVVLGDNVPGEHYGYLITVYTGARPFSGTSASVGIQLVGKMYKSKPHILNADQKERLQRNSVDWFVLFTSKCLGNLIYIQLWHDNNGHNPAWYCQDVVVRDIQTRQMWIFLLNRWISVSRGTRNAHYAISASSKKEQRAAKVLFVDNASNIFRDNHIWFSIFLRHPRSNFTRCQRVSVVACGVMLAMLANIMFYGIPQGHPADQFSVGHFTLSKSTIMIGIECALVTVPIAFLLVLAYRKTMPKSVTRAKGQAVFLSTALANITRSSVIKETSNDSDNIEDNTDMDTLTVKSQLPQVEESGDSDRSEKKKTVQKGKLAKLTSCFKQDENKKYIHGISSQYFLPSWFRYVLWSFCVIITVISAYLIILYGLSYGRVKSYLWLTSMLSAIFLSIFVIDPLKIILIAIILTVLIKSQPKVSDLERGVPLELDVSEQFHIQKVKAMAQRKQSALGIYQPISEKELVKMREHELTHQKHFDMTIDIVMFVVYIVTLYGVILGNRDHLGYHSTRNAKELFIDGAYGGNISFGDINNFEDFISYIQSTFIPALHKYDSKKTISEETGWTADLNSKLLGVSRLRQLRIKNNTCTAPYNFKQHMKCNTEFSTSVQDKKNYSLNWKQSNNVTSSERAMLPWLYQTSWASSTWPLQGEIHVYPGGGYISNLGKTRNNSFAVMDFLVTKHWFDDLTRAVIIEFTIYNANRNLFNVISLLVEISATGAYVTNHNIQTITLLYISDNIRVTLIILFVVLVCILGLFFLKQLLILKRYSIRDYFSNFWNVIDISIVLMGFGCIGIYFTRGYYVSTLIKTLEDADGNEFVSFFGACYVEKALDYLTAFLICVSTIRLWKLLRFNQHFKIFETTLILCAGSLLSLTIMFIIILLAFCVVTYLLMGHTVHKLRDTYHCMSTLMSIFLRFETDVDYITFIDVNRILGPILYFSFCVIVSIYITNMFITVIILHYSVARWKQSIKTHKLNWFEFIKKEFKYHILRKHKSAEEIRLRGGADDPDIAPPALIKKSDEQLKANEMTISHSKMAANNDKLKESTLLKAPKQESERVESNERLNAMAAVTIDEYENRKKNKVRNKNKYVYRERENDINTEMLNTDTSSVQSLIEAIQEDGDPRKIDNLQLLKLKLDYLNYLLDSKGATTEDTQDKKPAEQSTTNLQSDSPRPSVETIDCYINKQYHKLTTAQQPRSCKSVMEATTAPINTRTESTELKKKWLSTEAKQNMTRTKYQYIDHCGLNLKQTKAQCQNDNLCGCSPALSNTQIMYLLVPFLLSDGTRARSVLEYKQLEIPLSDTEVVYSILFEDGDTHEEVLITQEHQPNDKNLCQTHEATQTPKQLSIFPKSSTLHSAKHKGVQTDQVIQYGTIKRIQKKKSLAQSDSVELPSQVCFYESSESPEKNETDQSYTTVIQIEMSSSQQELHIVPGELTDTLSHISTNQLSSRDIQSFHQLSDDEKIQYFKENKQFGVIKAAELEFEQHAEAGPSSQEQHQLNHGLHQEFTVSTNKRGHAGTCCKCRECCTVGLQPRLAHDAEMKETLHQSTMYQPSVDMQQNNSKPISNIYINKHFTENTSKTFYNTSSTRLNTHSMPKINSINSSEGEVQNMEVKINKQLKPYQEENRFRTEFNILENRIPAANTRCNCGQLTANSTREGPAPSTQSDCTHQPRSINQTEQEREGPSPLTQSDSTHQPRSINQTEQEREGPSLLTESDCTHQPRSINQTEQEREGPSPLTQSDCTHQPRSINQTEQERNTNTSQCPGVYPFWHKCELQPGGSTTLQITQRTGQQDHKINQIKQSQPNQDRGTSMRSNTSNSSEMQPTQINVQVQNTSAAEVEITIKPGNKFQIDLM